MRNQAILTRVLFGIALLAGGGGMMTGTTSCAKSPDRSRATFLLLPDLDTYRTQVDPYLQRRCGTLDCHGQVGRPYRLYGFSGLRDYTDEAGLVSGQQKTTDAEIVSNFQATVGIEPEEMSRVVARQGQGPETLIFLRKPMKLERHKGGKLIQRDDDGYRCITGWLRVRTVRAPTGGGGDDDDTGDIETIPVDERKGMTPSELTACKNAQANP